MENVRFSNLLGCQIGYIIMMFRDASTAAHSDAHGHAHNVLSGQIAMSGIDIIVSQIGCLDVHSHLLLIDHAGHVIRIHNCKTEAQLKIEIQFAEDDELLSR